MTIAELEALLKKAKQKQEKTTIAELEARLKKAEQKIVTQEQEKILKQEQEKIDNLKTQTIFTSNKNSDEKKALRFYGAKNIGELITKNTAHNDFRHVPSDIKYLVQNFKKDYDVACIMNQILNGASNNKNVLESTYFAKNVLAPQFKAFGSDIVGGGSEYIPTILSSMFIDEFELERKLMSMFKPYKMQSATDEIPVKNNLTKARLDTASCDLTGSITPANFGTSSLTVTAKRLSEYYCLPEDLVEDSLPDILAMARVEVVEAQSRAWESAGLNGDDSVTHMDADVTGAEDADKAWKGLRKRALDNSATVDFAAAAPTISKVRALRSLMGKYGANVRDLMLVSSTKVNNQLLDFPEVTTVEKFGQAATILTGSLAALDGIPLMISEFQKDNLDATGVNAAPADALSNLILVNKTRFYMATRSPLSVAVSRDPRPNSHRWQVGSTWRGDFAGLPQSATEKSVVMGINII